MVGPENEPKRQHIKKGNPHTLRSTWEEVIKRKQVGRWMGDTSAGQFYHNYIIPSSAIFLGHELDLVDAGREGQLVDLGLAPKLKIAYDKLDPKLQAELTLLGGPSAANISYLRTSEHVSSVVKAMNGAQKSLVLISRGNDHKGEFISITENLGLGYLVFIPEGLFVNDPLLTMIYAQAIDAKQRFLDQE